jgi:transcriptional regulator with XRE-family HTH domain
MIDPEDIGDLTLDVARRLRRTREALGVDQQEFGTRAGLSQPQYNQYEKGKRRLTLEAALLLCNEYNLNLDWLYRGDPSNLPYKLAAKIRNDRESPTGRNGT